MLFNSHFFIFIFLPITLIVYYLLGGRRRSAAAVWVTLASLFFYGWWNPNYLILIIFSMVFNYTVGLKLRGSAGTSKGLFIFGVLVNLALIAYFKYANFFVDSINAVSGAGLALDTIILPLAISFFTFQQIAYLADA